MFYTTHNFSNLTINYVSAPCGSGKTYSVIDHIAKYYNDQKVIVVAPSIQLGFQYVNGFVKHNIKATCINSETVFSVDATEKFHTVKEAVHDAIKKLSHITSDGGVIIITLSTFQHIDPNWFDSSWTFVMDEIPAVDSYTKLELPYNYGMVAEYIATSKTLNNKQYQLEIADLEKAKDLIYKKTKHDDFFAMFKQLVRDLLEGHQVIVDSGSWDRLVNNYWIDKKERDPDGLYTLHFISFFTPYLLKNFGKIIMLGANFEYSLLYELWSQFYNVNFVRDKKLESKLRFTTHPNGHRLKITFLQEEDFSRYQATQESNGISVIEYHINEAKKIFGEGTPVACSLNVPDEHYKPKDWVKVSLMSHGLNCYSSYNNFFHGASLNKYPKQFSMLTDYGLSPKTIENSFHNETAYQIICRSSLRDLSSEEPVHVVVVDRRAAEYISRLFMNSKIGDINGKYKTIVKLNRLDKLKKKKMDILFESRKLAISYWGEEDSLDETPRGEKGKVLCHFLSRKESDTKNCLINLNVFANVYCRDGISGEFDIVEFTKVMRSSFKNNIMDSKEDNDLFNVGCFNNNIRKTDNFEATNIIAFDVDGGELSAKQMRKIFKKCKYPYLITNSASNGIDGKERYRAIVYMDQMMNKETHDIVYDYFLDLFKKHHYYTFKTKISDDEFNNILKRDPLAKRSGIDWSKRNVASIFYLPGQVRGREDHAFFYTEFTTAHEFKHYAVSVDDILKASIHDEDDMESVYAEDIKQIEESTEEAISTKVPHTIIKKIDDIIANMGNGHRSHEATRIGGYISLIHKDYRDYYDNYYSGILRNKGCDVSAMSSYKKYVRQHS